MMAEQKQMGDKWPAVYTKPVYTKEKTQAQTH